MLEEKKQVKVMNDVDCQCFKSTNEEVVGYDQLITYGLWHETREVKNDSEYQYLLTVSQCPFESGAHTEGYWIEGYPISVTPIDSTEHFYLIDWLLKNGDTVRHPVALSPGMDDNYQKITQSLQVEAHGKTIQPDILMKRCGLYVLIVFEGGQFSYELHDVCHLDTLQEVSEDDAQVGVMII